MRIKPNAQKSTDTETNTNEKSKLVLTAHPKHQEEELLPLSGNPVKKYVPPIQHVEEQIDEFEEEEAEKEDEEYLDLDNMPKKRSRDFARVGPKGALKSASRSRPRPTRTIKAVTSRNGQSDSETDSDDELTVGPVQCRFVDDFDHVESNKVYALLGPGLSKMSQPTQNPMERLKAIYQVKEDVKFPAYNKYILSRKAAILKSKEDKERKYHGAKKQAKPKTSDFVYD